MDTCNQPLSNCGQIKTKWRVFYLTARALQTKFDSFVYFYIHVFIINLVILWTSCRPILSLINTRETSWIGAEPFKDGAILYPKAENLSLPITIIRVACDWLINNKNRSGVLCSREPPPLRVFAGTTTHCFLH